MEKELKKRREDLEIRPCVETELDEVMLLQESIYKNMQQKDWFAVASRDENKRFMKELNVILGVLQTINIFEKVAEMQCFRHF